MKKNKNKNSRNETSGKRDLVRTGQKPQKPFQKKFIKTTQERGDVPGTAPENRMPRPELYGFHAVSAAWLNEERKIQALYVCDQSLEEFKSVMDEAGRRGLQRPPATRIEKKRLESLLPPGAVYQGLALVCSPLPEIGLRDLIIRGENREKSVILVLDQITDPHNVGAILRSACAFGANGIVMQRRHAPELTGALAKAACGALEHVPVAYETNLSRAVEELQEAGYFVFGLDERGEKNMDDVEMPKRAALVLGAEGPGLRHLIREHCDMLVRLPMNGPMPSINVSNAAAIALYVASRK